MSDPIFDTPDAQRALKESQNNNKPDPVFDTPDAHKILVNNVHQWQQVNAPNYDHVSQDELNNHYIGPSGYDYGEKPTGENNKTLHGEISKNNFASDFNAGMNQSDASQSQSNIDNMKNNPIVKWIGGDDNNEATNYLYDVNKEKQQELDKNKPNDLSYKAGKIFPNLARGFGEMEAVGFPEVNPIKAGKEATLAVKGFAYAMNRFITGGIWGIGQTALDQLSGENSDLVGNVVGMGLGNTVLGTIGEHIAEPAIKYATGMMGKITAPITNGAIELAEKLASSKGMQEAWELATNPRKYAHDALNETNLTKNGTIRGDSEETSSGGLNNSNNSITDVNSNFKSKTEEKPPEIEKDHKKMAYDIVSKATGKSKTWLKSQLEGKAGLSTQKRRDTIQKLIDNSGDKIDEFDPAWAKYFGGHDFYNNSELNQGVDLANEALDRILGKKFNIPKTISPEEEYYTDISKKYDHALNLYKNSKNVDLAEEYILKHIPKDEQDMIFQHLYTDIDKIANGKEVSTLPIGEFKTRKTFTSLGDSKISSESAQNALGSHSQYESISNEDSLSQARSLDQEAARKLINSDNPSALQTTANIDLLRKAVGEGQTNDIDELGKILMDQGSYEESLANQMKASGTKIATDEMKEQANLEALKRSFQDENKLSNFATGVVNLLNKLIPGLGSIAEPFPKVPANLLARSLEYGPTGIYNIVKEIKPLIMQGDTPFNQRDLALAIGRTAVGSYIMYNTYNLAKEGILKGSNKDGRFYDSNGIPQYSINSDAILRKFKGEDSKPRKGDHWTTYDWLKPASSVVGIGANMAQGNNIIDSIMTVPKTLSKQSTVLLCK